MAKKRGKASKAPKSSGGRKGGGKDGGPNVRTMLLAALVVGAGLFAGIRYTDRAQALVNGLPAHHVVELVPPEQVRNATEPKPSRHHHRAHRPAGVEQDSD